MQNDMRDRLVELYKEATTLYFDYLDSIDEKGLTDTEGRAKFTIDHLIANGVILPPCKVGQTVWWIDKKRVLDMVCVGFLKTHKKLLVAIARNTNAFTTHYYVEWSVDIFLTKEQAEQKLKELSENGNL